MRQLARVCMLAIVAHGLTSCATYGPSHPLSSADAKPLARAHAARFYLANHETVIVRDPSLREDSIVGISKNARSRLAIPTASVSDVSILDRHEWRTATLLALLISVVTVALLACCVGFAN